MKEFFRKQGYKFQQFMVGRYGVDKLCLLYTSHLKTKLTKHQESHAEIITDATITESN